jgi:uncharacterized membrane protein
MCKNVGSADRAVRALIGVVALALAFTRWGVMSGSVLGIVAAVVGVIMLGTAAMGACPLYMALKVSTCKTARQ